MDIKDIIFNIGKKMMKRLILFFFLLCFLGFLFADLIDVYKKGEIKIVPDPEFGKNTDWDLLFYKGIAGISFDPNGCFFVSGRGLHEIFKFDSNGNLVKSFGQKGQGPGDFISPRCLSILDNKYLVIGEYALNRKISLFDLDGEFKKVVRTDYYAYDSVALENNKIAILSKSVSNTDKEFITTCYSIFIKDIVNGKDFKVISFDEKKPNIYKREGSVIVPGTYYGNVYLVKIDNTKFLVGFSEIPDISIYSVDGKKLYSFEVKFESKKVTENIKKKFFSFVAEERKIKILDTNKFMKKMEQQVIFPEYTPYYSEIRVDSDHNILVCQWKGERKIEDARFQVYSKEGQFICETKIESDNFEPAYPRIFHKNYAYFILRSRGNSSFSLERVELKK